MSNTIRAENGKKLYEIYCEIVAMPDLGPDHLKWIEIGLDGKSRWELLAEKYARFMGLY